MSYQELKQRLLNTRIEPKKEDVEKALAMEQLPPCNTAMQHTEDAAQAVQHTEAVMVVETAIGTSKGWVPLERREYPLTEATAFISSVDRQMAEKQLKDLEAGTIQYVEVQPTAHVTPQRLQELLEIEAKWKEYRARETARCERQRNLRAAAKKRA